MLKILIQVIIVPHHLTNLSASTSESMQSSQHDQIFLSPIPVAIRKKLKVPTIIYKLFYDLVPVNHPHDFSLLQISPLMTPF